MAFDAASGLVLARYRGYEDAAEDEWRPLVQLRAFEPHPPSSWRSTKQVKGEMVEVLWAPPDHPTARWEAVVSQVRVNKAQVRFVGFSANWDTWLPHDSKQMFPARAAACAAS